MTEIESVELFRQDGEKFRSVRLLIEKDGAIRLDAQDIGPRVKQWWGGKPGHDAVGVVPHSTLLLFFTFSASTYTCPPIALNLSLISFMPAFAKASADKPASVPRPSAAFSLSPRL